MRTASARSQSHGHHSGDTGISRSAGTRSRSPTSIPTATAPPAPATASAIRATSRRGSSFLRVTADVNDESASRLSWTARSVAHHDHGERTSNGSTGCISSGQCREHFALDGLTVEHNGDNGIDFTAAARSAPSRTSASARVQRGQPPVVRCHGLVTASVLTRSRTERAIRYHALQRLDDRCLRRLRHRQQHRLHPDVWRRHRAPWTRPPDISDFQVTSNEADYGGGIGIDEIVAGGTVDITTTLVYRRANAEGGGSTWGSWRIASRFTLTVSTIASNHLNGLPMFGGGIAFGTLGNDTAIAPVLITRTTVADNTASFGGGIFAPAVSGLAGQHTLVIDSSTVSGNSASDAAGLAVQSDAISSVPRESASSTRPSPAISRLIRPARCCSTPAARRGCRPTSSTPRSP